MTVVVVSIGALLGVPVAAHAAVVSVVCGQVVTTDTTLAADVGPCAANGIVAGADGITIDLAGHRVFGVAANNDGAGVKLEGRSNVTVKNGTVSDFDAGVLIRGGGQNTVTGLTARDNLGVGSGPIAPMGDGIAIEGSSGNQILANTTQRNGPFAGIGIYQNSDADHPFTTAPATDNVVARNMVLDNTACRGAGGSCDASGIRIEPGVSAGNVIDDNDVRGNGIDGISVFGGANGVTIKNNRLSLNGFFGSLPGDGIRIFGYANTITNNRSLNNKAGGISVGRRTTLGPGNFTAPNGRDNVITDNVATGNGTLDLWDSFATTPCDNNQWLRNKYQKTSPVCTTAGGAEIQPPVGDFDNDGKTDVAVFRPDNGTWYIKNSRLGTDTTVAFGTAGDIPVAADYDGDGYADPAVYRPGNGVWYVHRSTGSDTAVAFGGAAGDLPVPADYDGDGKTDLGIFRPGPQATWYLSRSTQGLTTISFGTTGDIAVPADYGGNGDPAADVAVYRPSTGVWYVDGVTTVAFGTTGDIPAPGDYAGDARTDMSVFRPSNGTWYVQGGAVTPYGTSGDVPVPGNYVADAKTDLGIFRTQGDPAVWHISGGPTVPWGLSGDRPVPLPGAIRQSFFP